MKLENIKSNQFYKLFFTSAMILSFALSAAAQDDEDEDYISPVRPSVSEDVMIQKKGVLQVEYGADFDFKAPDFRNRQTAPSGFYFAAAKNLRLDVEFQTVTSQKDRAGQRETGIGDVNLGFKAIARDRPKERLGIAFAYLVKLPTADEERELGTGKVDHNLRLIFDRKIGKNDFIANFSYLNVVREMSDKRASGAQVILRYDRELSKKVNFINEFFGNTVDEEQPRGLYYLGAITYNANKRLQFDVGVRPGFGQDAPKFNFFFGLSVGAIGLYRKR
jgi:hypothetical protein